MNRETWLNEMAALMAPRFEELGFPIPPYRVTLGWTSTGVNANVRGECWSNTVSSDKVFEIFIAPHRDDSVAILGTLAHELAHAAAGFEHGHRGDFAKIVLALGLLRPVTHSTPGPDFEAWVAPMIEKLGTIPHARLLIGDEGRALRIRPAPGSEGGEEGEGEGESEAPRSSNHKPKQTTRMLKAECDGLGDGCGYTVRLSRKWAEQLGAPHCPKHGEMQMEGADA